MLKKKAMIYPVDREAIPLLRYNHLLESFDIIYAVSPKGWGFNGKDYGTIDGGKPINKEITTDFDSGLDICQCVIFTESDRRLNFENIILPKIKLAIEHNKDIVCTLDIPQNFKEEIELLCKVKGVKFEYYQRKVKDNFKKIDKEYVYDINVPIMGILGTTERTGKFNIQLALREKFINEGYKVAQIGTNHYSELLGFHSFPSFMMNNNISESNKIMLFNHYVKKIELEEEPDIILIGIPGGVMTYNNNYTNRFGILAFEICNAVQFDSTVISTLYNDYNEEYFVNMYKALKYKLGIEIDAFNLTPLKGDFETLDIMNRFSYLTLSSDFIDKKIKCFNNEDFKVCNILNDKNKEELSNYLIDKLASYSEIQAI